MSVLDRIREKFKVPAQATSRTSGSPSAGFAGSPDRHLKSCSSLCTEFRRACHHDAPPLSAASQAAQCDVLARLEADPTIRRAFVSRFEGDVMILTLAVRDVGMCELAIPAETFDRDSLADYQALAACVGSPELAK